MPHSPCIIHKLTISTTATRCCSLPSSSLLPLPLLLGHPHKVPHGALHATVVAQESEDVVLLVGEVLEGKGPPKKETTGSEYGQGRQQSARKIDEAVCHKPSKGLEMEGSEPHLFASQKTPSSCPAFSNRHLTSIHTSILFSRTATIYLCLA